MIKNYFKTAFRHLKRNKVYSLINILGLSLGLACTMMIMLYVKDEVSYDRFHSDAGQIYRVVNKNVTPEGSIQNLGTNTGYFQGPRFAAAIPEIKAFVRYQSGQMDLKKDQDVKSQEIMYVDSNFFSVFSFPLLQGNSRTALSKPNTAVISEEMAKKQFGTSDAIGQTMLFKNGDKFDPYTITGVASRIPQNSSIKFDVLMPLQVSKEEEANNENWFNFFLNTFVKLAPDADIKKVEAKMKNVYETDAAEAIKLAAEKFDAKNKMVYFLQPFTDIHLNKELGASNGLVDDSSPAYSYILSGIAIFILLIACINFVNLTVARSVKRAKEIGIRKVIGSGRKQLMMQFLGESFVLCFIAFALALGIVQLLLPVFNELSNKKLALSYLFDVKLVTGYVLLFILTGILAGFYPALVLSKYNPVQTLYSRFMLAGKNYLQKSLVVLQFALASFLIIATITIFFQFDFLITRDLGYDDSNLVALGKDNLTRDQARILKNELMKNPLVTGVAPKNSGFWATVAKVNGEEQVSFAYETVDETYLPLMKIPLVNGRNFSPDFPSDSTHAVLVNETFVKKAGWKEPIGQQVNFWYNDNEKYTVIGVVKDYHFESLNRKINTQLFTMKPSNSYGRVFIKIKPGSETAALQHIETVFKKLFPIHPYTYRFLEESNRRNYEAEAKWKQIMLFSAVLTIFISCIGLFGLSVLAAEKRTKEVGVRKVLGASVGHVVGILSKDFVKLVIIALLLAIPGAWIAVNKWLDNYPYRISLSWWMFASAGILVIVIALITVSFQAIKAAISNPVKSLRTE